jgi:hypothetical protein
VTAAGAAVTARNQDSQPQLPDDNSTIGQLRTRIRVLDAGLDDTGLTDAITQALPKAFQQRQAAAELDRQPRLLLGEGVPGSPGIIRLIDTLTSRGARGITAPPCPLCGSAVPLRYGRDGKRCCRRCYDQPRQQPCARCGQVKDVVTRTPDGQPLCGSCRIRDPAKHEPCGRCGRMAAPARHEPDGTAVCYSSSCRQPELDTCTVCGKYKPCSGAGTSSARCATCVKMMNKAPCGRCGAHRVVSHRTADGEPLCQMCGAPREACSTCGRIRRVTARPGGKPLCRTCYRNDPSSLRACSNCGTTAQTYHHGLCHACAAPGQVRAMLSVPGQPMRADLEPVADALTRTAPASLLKWLESRPARQVLAAVAVRPGPVTHTALDQIQPSRAVAPLRAALMAAGLLPMRDEQLAAFERWLQRALSGIDDDSDQRLIRSYVTWGPLRRLRRTSARQLLTHGQQVVARSEVQAAIRITRWLRGRQLALAACQQADIDQWLASAQAGRYLARHFLQWCTARGYAGDVEIPATARGTHPASALPEADQRWAIACDLLHGTGHDSADRVAGCLVLLYAQPLTRITRLTTSHVSDEPAGMRLRLGDTPVEVPEPLATQIRDLVGRRRGHAAIGHTDDSPWLFPGGRAGQPISAARLQVRLTRLGITARAGRAAALMDLAAQLPAVVLSKLLSISLGAATGWNQAAGNTRAGYAAEVARRQHRS